MDAHPAEDLVATQAHFPFYPPGASVPDDALVEHEHMPYHPGMQYSAYMPQTATPVVPSHGLHVPRLNIYAHQPAFHQPQPDLHTPSSLDGESPPLYNGAGHMYQAVHAHAHAHAHPRAHAHGILDSPVSFDPHAPPLDGPPSLSDASTDGPYHSASHSSGPASPASGRGLALYSPQVRSARFNPIATSPSPAHSSSSSRGHARRRSSPPTPGHDYGFSDGEDGLDLGGPPANRKEMTRRQRIEAEQRRRDELREAYSRLRAVLPPSNQKSSKVALLDRATTYICKLEHDAKATLARLQATTLEMDRLRQINESISVSLSEGRPAGHPSPPGGTLNDNLHADVGHIRLDDTPLASGPATVEPAVALAAPPLDGSQPGAAPPATF